MIKAIDFLPLGTVLVLRGNPRKVMVVARAVVVNQPEGRRYYDYGACLWPEGVLGDELAYFNQDAIRKVVQEGHSDGDEELMAETLREGVGRIDVPQGRPIPQGVTDGEGGDDGR